MKKLVLMMVFALSSMIAYADEAKQLEFLNFKENTIEQGNMFVSLMGKNWKIASDGENYCALVRVLFENIPMIDAEKVKFSTGHGYIQVDNSRLNERQEMWLWLDPVGGTYIKAQTADNHSATYTIDNKLKSKGVYEVTLKSNKTVSVFVETLPQGVVVTMENGQKAVTPEPLHNVSLGEHTITLSLNGQEKMKQTINVTETNVKFGPYDLREKKMVEFTSEPSGAYVLLEGEGFKGEEIGKTPLKKELPYGNYKVKVYLSPTEVDERNFSVGANTAEKIALEPIKKKTFEVTATYGGRKVDASLYIDGKHIGSNQSKYQLVRPIGKKYEMEMTYMGNSKKRTIKVTEGMNPTQEFKIAARKSFVWPWQREFDPTIGGVTFGYVNKFWETSGNGRKTKYDLWGDEDKAMHGFRVGVYFTPALQCGLGVYTGLFYEMYFSECKDPDYDGFMFTEYVLSLPLHAYYRLRLGEKVHIAVHGGLGIDWALKGSLTDSEGNSEDASFDYGNYSPNAYNLSTDIALELRIKNLGINAFYSKGFTEHEGLAGYEEECKQYKMGIGLSYMFSTGD